MTTVTKDERCRVDVIIPALNEESAIGLVLREIPPRVRRVVVSDNGSTDDTADVALAAGAEVVFEPERGYGAACLRAMAHLEDDPPDVVVFLDGDHSDHPGQLGDVIAPIEAGVADLVIGSRARGHSERGSLTVPQRVGNAFACGVLRWVYGVHFSDLGPFRGVRWSTLQSMGMRDRNYGWTVEMQIRAARQGVRCAEVPVDYRVRVGESKVSGTVRGTVMASAKILFTLARHCVA